MNKPTRTKGELEDRIVYLEQRVAALEGAVTAYRFALEQANGPAPTPIIPWPNTVWPQIFPTVTS